MSVPGGVYVDRLFSVDGGGDRAGGGPPASGSGGGTPAGQYAELRGRPAGGRNPGEVDYGGTKPESRDLAAARLSARRGAQGVAT